jgi:hypothetical protein
MRPATYLALVAIIVAIMIAIVFIPVARYFGLPFAIGPALSVPMMLAGAAIKRCNGNPPATCALFLGAPGFIVVVVAFMAQSLAMRLSPPPLPAAIEIPVVLLAWIGVALLAISDLLFVVVASGALLTRLRAPA